jgi:hypothetical protein
MLIKKLKKILRKTIILIKKLKKILRETIKAIL